MEACRFALVVSDSLDAFLHAPNVSIVEVVFMLSVDVFGLFFMPFFRFGLVTLNAVVSPSLKALLHAFKRFCASIHPWFLVWQHLFLVHCDVIHTDADVENHCGCIFL